MNTYQPQAVSLITLCLCLFLSFSALADKQPDLMHAVFIAGPNFTGIKLQPETDTEHFGGKKAKNWPFTAIRTPQGTTVVACTARNKASSCSRAT